MSHADPEGKDPSRLREGDDLRFQFELTDAATKLPVTGGKPAVWLDAARAARGEAQACQQRVKRLLEGSLMSRAEVNLNTYYVLSLNDDASISVVDPLFGYGASKLLSMIPLTSRGQDWALSQDSSRLFVTMPASGKVAVVDTASWKIVRHLDAGPSPDRVAIAPRGGGLWVSHGGGGAESGVAVFDTRELTPQRKIVTGRGPHEIAFSGDGRHAFVINKGSGTVSVVNAREGTGKRDIAVGNKPSSAAFSELSQMAYVADEQSGVITVLSTDAGVEKAEIRLEPGISQVRIAPGGKFGFVVNRAKSKLYVFDTVTNRVLQSGGTEPEPDQITFSDRIAYIRHRGSETVLMVGLDSISLTGSTLQVIDFPGGQNPFGRVKFPSPADGIVQAPGENAVLVANPADKAIYFYKEGMAAPMGNFTTYGREPRAIMVVDRSLSQRAPGVFQTTARMPKPGHYSVAFFLDSPRAVHCFDLDVEQNSTPAKTPETLVTALVESTRIPAGGEALLRFRLSDAGGVPVSGLRDVRVMIYLVPGTWHIREWAQPTPVEGVYSMAFSPPGAGTYHVFLECLSRGLKLNRPRVLTLEAFDRDGAEPRP